MEIIVAALLHLFSDQTKVTEPMLRRQASAALAAERATGVDAFLLLGLAYEESRFQPWQVSYAKACTGTGKERRCERGHASVPNGSRPEGAMPSFYCGVTQVGGYISWSRCVDLMQNIEENYLFAAEHLKAWLRDPHCSKRTEDDQLTCALLGNGGGYGAIRAWEAKAKHRVLSYPSRCLHRAKQLRRFTQSVSKT